MKKPRTLLITRGLVLASAVLAAAALLMTVPRTASAAKGGKGGDNSGSQFQRARFGVPAGVSSAAIMDDGGGACTGDPGFPYWSTTSAQDPGCGPSGNMEVTLTGSGGLWFRTYRGTTNLNESNTPNRYFVLDFGAVGNPSCPDLDTQFYSAAALGSDYGTLSGYFVPVPLAGCQDRVEALIRVGSQIFDLPVGATFSGDSATLEVVLPSINRKGKKSTIEWQQTGATLRFVSPLEITDSGIDDDELTFTCGDGCTVSLTEQGTPIGDFVMPTELTIKRVTL